MRFILEGGRPINIDLMANSLGKGGEGKILSLPGSSSHVVKIYQNPVSKQQAEKLKLLVAKPIHDPMNMQGEFRFAWPEQRILTENGQVIGFTMRKVIQCPTLSQIYNPRSPYKVSDQTTKLKIATSFCEIFQRLYAHGPICFGDINDGNFHVHKHRVIAVDLNSIQITTSDGRTYTCDVGREEFTAPELLREGRHNLIRTHAHDAWGIGVLVWQILMKGHHPFAAVGVSNPVDGVRTGRWPYAPGSSLQPPSEAPSFKNLPQELRDLFTRAFHEGLRDPSVRPTPDEWVHVLTSVQAPVPTIHPVPTVPATRPRVQPMPVQARPGTRRQMLPMLGRWPSWRWGRTPLVGASCLILGVMLGETRLLKHWDAVRSIQSAITQPGQVFAEPSRLASTSLSELLGQTKDEYGAYIAAYTEFHDAEMRLQARFRRLHESDSSKRSSYNDYQISTWIYEMDMNAYAVLETTTGYLNAAQNLRRRAVTLDAALTKLRAYTETLSKDDTLEISKPAMSVISWYVEHSKAVSRMAQAEIPASLERAPNRLGKLRETLGPFQREVADYINSNRLNTDYVRAKWNEAFAEYKAAISQMETGRSEITASVGVFRMEAQPPISNILVSAKKAEQQDEAEDLKEGRHQSQGVGQ